MATATFARPTFLVVVFGDMESIKEMVVVVNEDVSRTGTIFQDGNHFTSQFSVLVLNQSFQAPAITIPSVNLHVTSLKQIFSILDVKIQ